MFIKFDFDGLLDMDLLDAIMYAIIMSANNKNGRIDDKGELYKRLPNNYITYWIPELPKREISMSLNRLEEYGYIKTLTVRRPSNQLRFIAPVNKHFNDTIYILKDWLNKYCFETCIALGYLFRDYMHCDAFDEDDLEDLEDLIPDVLDALVSDNLTNEKGYIKEDLYLEFDEYKKLLLEKFNTIKQKV